MFCSGALSADKSPTISEQSAGLQSVVSASGAAETNVDASTAPFYVSLPPSLSNFYDPSLIGHISGWPAEQIELRVIITYQQPPYAAYSDVM